MRPYALVVLAVIGLANAQSSGDRQVRLDDIERENLKSPQQTPQQQQQQLQRPQQYATQQYTTQYQQQPLIQYTPQYYNVPAAAPSAPAGQLFAQPSLTPGQLSSYHQQLLFAGPQQISQPVLIPQHQSLPFPVMLIPSSYLLQHQDVNSLLYGGGLVQQAKYAAPTAQQIPAGPSKGFRPSPQLSGYTTSQYTPSSSLVYQNPQQYNAYQTVYQQKYATGVKSTVAPPLKDNYVGQSSSNVYSSYKVQ